MKQSTKINLIKYQECIFVERRDIKHRTPFRLNDGEACDAGDGSVFLYTARGGVCPPEKRIPVFHRRLTKSNSCLTDVSSFLDFSFSSFQNHEQVTKYLSSLETLLFTADLDSRILSPFNQFKALSLWFSSLLRSVLLLLFVVLIQPRYPIAVRLRSKGNTLGLVLRHDSRWVVQGNYSFWRSFLCFLEYFEKNSFT